MRRTLSVSAAAVPGRPGRALHGAPPGRRLRRGASSTRALARDTDSSATASSGHFRWNALFSLPQLRDGRRLERRGPCGAAALTQAKASAVLQGMFSVIIKSSPSCRPRQGVSRTPPHVSIQPKAATRPPPSAPGSPTRPRCLHVPPSPLARPASPPRPRRGSPQTGLFPAALFTVALWKRQSTHDLLAAPGLKSRLPAKCRRPLEMTPPPLPVAPAR